MSKTITFGGDDTVFCFNYLGVSGLSRFYAATLAKGDLIELSMTGKNVTLDYEMSIYQKNGSGSYVRVVRTTALETPYLNFYPQEAGDYVFAFSNMRKGASGSADISLKRLNETVADRFEAFEALELSEVPLKETFDYHDASLYNREFVE